MFDAKQMYNEMCFDISNAVHIEITHCELALIECDATEDIAIKITSELTRLREEYSVMTEALESYRTSITSQDSTFLEKLMN